MQLSPPSCYNLQTLSSVPCIETPLISVIPLGRETKLWKTSEISVMYIYVYIL
jgi:hypothetical protein